MESTAPTASPLWMPSCYGLQQTVYNRTEDTSMHLLLLHTSVLFKLQCTAWNRRVKALLVCPNTPANSEPQLRDSTCSYLLSVMHSSHYHYFLLSSILYEPQPSVCMVARVSSQALSYGTCEVLPFCSAILAVHQSRIPSHPKVLRPV